MIKSSLFSLLFFSLLLFYFFCLFRFFRFFLSFSFRFARSRLRLSLYYCYEKIYNKNVSFFSNYNKGDLSFSNYDDTRNASDMNNINKLNCNDTRNANDMNNMSESSVKNKTIFFLIELLSLFMFSKKSKPR